MEARAWERDDAGQVWRLEPGLAQARRPRNGSGISRQGWLTLYVIAGGRASQRQDAVRGAVEKLRQAATQRRLETDPAGGQRTRIAQSKRIKRCPPVECDENR